MNRKARNLPSFLLLPVILCLAHFQGSLHMSILHCLQMKSSWEQQGSGGLDFGGFHSFLFLLRVKLGLGHSP